jgi:hypothetical protein
MWGRRRRRGLARPRPRKTGRHWAFGIGEKVVKERKRGLERPRPRKTEGIGLWAFGIRHSAFGIRHSAFGMGCAKKKAARVGGVGRERRDEEGDLKEGG